MPDKDSKVIDRPDIKDKFIVRLEAHAMVFQVIEVEASSLIQAATLALEKVEKDKWITEGLFNRPEATSVNKKKDPLPGKANM